MKLRSRTIPAAGIRKPKTPRAKSRYVRKGIRAAVYVYYNGRKFETKCHIPWCDNAIDVFNFHASHVVPHSRGGEATLQNLRPTCQLCNTSMGAMHMSEWISLGER